MDFGSMSLDRCPGEKANGLFSRLKRCSSPGFGCIAAGHAVSWDDDPTVCSTPAEGLDSVSVARKAPLFDLEMGFPTGLTARGVDTNCRFMVVCLIHFVLDSNR